MSTIKNQLSPEEEKTLMALLEIRFQANLERHQGVHWADVKSALEAQPDKLWALNRMEQTGGEPDVVDFKHEEGLVFCDCSAESPAGRRSLCYDQEALESRKKFKPKGSAIEMARAMGVTLLDEADYRGLQTLGNFDNKTSSWLLTPQKTRSLGGAIFGDFRFNRVFVYHNGAESYYAARGFRGKVVL